MVLFHEEGEEFGSVSDDDRLDVPGYIDLMCFETLCRCRASEKQTSDSGCVVHKKPNIKVTITGQHVFLQDCTLFTEIGIYQDLGSCGATF